MRGIKLLCLVLAVVFIFSANLPAQGGIKGGINFPEFRSFKPEVLEHKKLTTFQVGVFYDFFKLTPYLQVHAEVLFIRKGTKLTMMENSVNKKYKIKVDYLEVPVLLKVNIIPKSPLNPYLIAGPYWAYRISAKRTGTGVTDDNFKDRTKESDFGLIGGGGIEFKLGKMARLLAEFRYEYGMTDTDKDPNVRTKNSSYVFNVGVGF